MTAGIGGGGGGCEAASVPPAAMAAVAELWMRIERVSLDGATAR
jgi:hypothetical protein